MIWTEELSDRVVKLWQYNSATQIAALLRSEGYVVTRNSIIGRIHRLDQSVRDKLEKHRCTKTGRGACRKIAATKRKEFRLRVAPDVPMASSKLFGDGYKPKTVEVASLDIRLVDLEPMQCRFACVRVDDEWRFCGHRTFDGSSFCEAHHALCWSKPVAARKQNPIYRETKRRAA